jgi:Fe-Mn family superoxide dismutase
MNAIYKSRYFDLGGLRGISDRSLEVHFKLYQDYVRATNLLTERIAELARQFADHGEATPLFPLLERRLGFEYHGMLLHEYYFGNLKPGGSGAAGGNLKKAMEESFGSYETWLADFKAISTMPGIGWAVTFQDPRNGWLSNHWITLHETNNIAGYMPIIVLDAWEHAFVPDYKANERAKYVDAYFSNLDYDAAEGRLK